MSNHPEKHLTVLGLEPGATSAEIRSAYKRLAIQWHPDKNESPEATSKFQEISHAYTALTDEGYRSDNDQEAEYAENQENLERFMNLFQRAFFGSFGPRNNMNFVFADAGSTFFDAWDEDVADQYDDLAELFPLLLIESTTSSLTVDWSESLYPVPPDVVYRLDIRSPERSLDWSACYLGVAQQSQITGLLPATQYELRLGVVDSCNELIDISSEAAFETKGNSGKRKLYSHPKIPLTTAVPNCNEYPELSYSWNMNQAAIYEKLVIDPDADTSSVPRRFNFGDDDDFEMVSVDEDDLYEDLSDGEILDEMWYNTDDDQNMGYFHQMNLNSGSNRFFNYQDDSENDNSPPRKLPKSSRLCRFFKQGACRYGNSCRFSHDPLHQKAFECDNNESAEECSDIDTNVPFHSQKESPRSRPMPACRFFQAGNCKKSNCKFSHDIKPNSMGHSSVPAGNTPSKRRQRRKH